MVRANSIEGTDSCGYGQVSFLVHMLGDNEDQATCLHMLYAKVLPLHAVLSKCLRALAHVVAGR